MTQTFVVTGTVTDARTLRLDEPLPIERGKVRITVEILDAAGPQQLLTEWLEDLRARRAAAGVAPLSDAQIDEWVREVQSGRGN